MGKKIPKLEAGEQNQPLNAQEKEFQADNHYWNNETTVHN